ncbi:MAG: hypothetical protein FWC77_06785 [Defluviitaleaceae bacterium]|nr:hypothetical protein [Defluviitaleaceae bacterium]
MNKNKKLHTVSKRNGNNINEKHFDAIMAAAIEESVAKEMESLPSREELDKLYPRSYAFDTRVMNMIKDAEGNTQGRGIVNNLKKIAAVACLLVMVGMVSLMSVESSRNLIFNTFSGSYDDFAAGDANDNTPDEDTRETIINYPSEGIVYVIGHMLDSQTVIIIYSNEPGERLILQ